MNKNQPFQQQIEELKKQILEMESSTENRFSEASIKLNELDKRNSQLSKDNIELKALLVKIRYIIDTEITKQTKQVDAEVYDWPE